MAEASKFFKNCTIGWEHYSNTINASSKTFHGEKSKKPTQRKQTRFTKPPHSKEQPGSSPNAKQDDSDSQAGRSPSASGGYSLQAYCHRCGHKGCPFGHVCILCVLVWVTDLKLVSFELVLIPFVSPLVVTLMIEGGWYDVQCTLSCNY